MPPRCWSGWWTPRRPGISAAGSSWSPATSASTSRTTRRCRRPAASRSPATWPSRSRRQRTPRSWRTCPASAWASKPSSWTSCTTAAGSCCPVRCIRASRMRPLRIFYVTNARLPTERAHGLATIKLAEAFAKHGLEVTLFRPWRVNPLRDDLYRYYGVEQNFRVATLPSLDFLWLGFGGRFFFVVQLLSFSVVTAIYLCLRYGLWGALRDTVIFSEDHVPLFFASLFTSNIFVDIHDYPTNNAWYGRVLRRAIGCSVQTRWKVDQLGRDFGIGREKIAYWPNGTETERFDTPVSRGEAQRALRLPLNRRLVLYVGSLPRWKGVETLVQAAAALPEDVTLYIVGGGNAEVERLRLKNQASGISN